MNGHCSTCPVEKDCAYEYKPCDCRDQLKFKPMPQPAQRTWVGLTEKEIDQGLCRTNYAMQTAGAWRDGVEWAIKQLQKRNI